VIEDLDMKGMSQALRFGKSVADSGWGMFTSFLQYKLKEQGKQLIKIDKWFPSTKTCSCCGNTLPMPMNVRMYVCS
ncbi:transposase, IS605 OrfB family, central region, partial [Gracilibacillus ureilyticus]